MCDVLGEGAASISCAESMRMDRESNVKELQYDAVALGAVSKGMVDEHKFRRSEVIMRHFSTDGKLPFMINGARTIKTTKLRVSSTTSESGQMRRRPYRFTTYARVVPCGSFLA